MSAPDPALLYPQQPEQQEEKPKKKLSGAMAVFLAWAAVGVIIGLSTASFDFRLTDVLPGLDGQGWMMVLGFFLSLWPHGLLHEAGHALAGRLVGMRLLVAGVGPWRVQKLAGRWRFFRLKHVAGVGGFAAMVPAQPDQMTRNGLIVFMLGGVAANFAIAALLGWWAAALEGGRLYGFLIGAVLSAIVQGVINLVPFTSKGWFSDGKQLLILLRKPVEAAGYLRLQRLSALAMSGVRPRDWPATDLPAPSTGDALTVNARLLDLCLAQWRMDSGQQLDDAALWQRLVRHHAALGDGHRQYAAVILARYAACHAQDAALLEAWLAHCQGGLVDLAPQRAVFTAHLAALQGRRDALPALMAEARALLPRTSDPATRLLLEEELDSL